LSNETLGRDEIVSFLTSHLVGPHRGDLEAIEHKPSRYYTAGVLFPRDLTEADGDIPDDASGEVEEDDPIPMSGQRQPSCLGLTFSTSSSSSLPKSAEVKTNDQFWSQKVGTNGYSSSLKASEVEKNCPNFDLLRRPRASKVCVDSACL